MGETVTIPKVEYDRLRALEEDLADVQAALAVVARLAKGEEELIPYYVVDRLLDGEPPLRVWREFRGLTQSELARASGVNRVQIVDIEADRNTRLGPHPAKAGRCPEASPSTTSSREQTTTPAGSRDPARRRTTS